MACINSCVLGEGTPFAFLNIFLIAAIMLSAIALIFFLRKLFFKKLGRASF